MKSKLGYDDSLDVVGIHCLGGIWGALATGLFASTAINPDGANGLFFGNPGQLWIQFVSIVATALFTAVATLIVIYVTKMITRGLRVEEEEEVVGLDNSIHGERAFELD